MWTETVQLGYEVGRMSNSWPMSDEAAGCVGVALPGEQTLMWITAEPGPEPEPVIGRLWN